ncbi:MAG: methyltransferase [Chloroflexota bacterium]
MNHTPAGDPYYRDHADAYDRTTRGVPGDVDWYVDHACRADGLVIELGVGTGRIAIPSALAGARVHGVDLEPAMLEVARRRAMEARVPDDRLTLAEGDMRSYATWQVPAPAALVTIPFRAFLHNLTTDDQLATLHACREALRPDGMLALNVFNPDLPLMARWMSRSSRTWAPWGGDGQARARHEYAPSGQTVTTRLRVVGPDGRRRTTEIRLRYVYRYEMEHLLARAGFRVESLLGDFAGTPFGEGSTEQIWTARRIERAPGMWTTSL